MAKPVYNAQPPKFFTAESLYHKTPNGPDGAWYELDHGTLVVCEPAGYQHAGLGVHLSSRLWLHVTTHRLGDVLGPDGTYILTRNPDTVRVPDVSFVRADRTPYGLAARKFFEGYPDFAVEIMSPTDRFPAVEKKVQEYLNAGTSLVWIIRPEDQTAIVYTPTQAPQKFATADVLTGDPVIPGWSIALGELFQK